MTGKQKFGFYLPVWNRCAAANQWISRGRPSRLVADLDAQEEAFRSTPGPVGEAGLRVIIFARQMAKQEHRAVTADDLRRACTLAATGKISSKHLNNTETNKLVAMLRLLINPIHITSVTEHEDPSIAYRRGLVARLGKMAPEGLLAHVFSNAYGTKHWEDGKPQQLIWLLKQFKGRTQSGAVVPVQEPEPELMEQPF
jgi:hypothetical protein